MFYVMLRFYGENKHFFDDYKFGKLYQLLMFEKDIVVCHKCGSKYFEAIIPDVLHASVHANKNLENISANLFMMIMILIVVIPILILQLI